MSEFSGNKFKLFEVSLDTKTIDIHVVFENEILDALNIDKDKFYKIMNDNKVLETEIRNICKILIESENK